MAASSGVVIQGVRGLHKNFKLAEKDIVNLTRTAVHRIAITVAQRAKKNVPKDTKRLVKAIKTKRRKVRNAVFRSDVRINYGKDSKDPRGAYYWFLIEYGSTRHPPQPFVAPALRATEPEAKQIFVEAVLKQAIKLMKRRNKNK